METFYHPFSKIKNKTSLSQIKSLHLQLLFSFIFRDFRSRGRGGKPITTEVWSVVEAFKCVCDTRCDVPVASQPPPPISALSFRSLSNANFPCMGEIFHAFVTRHFSAMSSTSSAAVFLISDWTFLLTERRHHSPHRFSFFCLWLGNNCLNENSAKQMCLISQSLNFAFLSKKPQDVIVWLHFYHSTLLAKKLKLGTIIVCSLAISCK